MEVDGATFALQRAPMFGCGHLLEDTDMVFGFVENASDPDDLQEWCDACEHKFREEMTPALTKFHRLTVVSQLCNVRIRERHTREQ